MAVDYLNMRALLEDKIRQQGGWVNCHAHLDRAYTITAENFALSNKLRHEKWQLNAEIRKNSTVDQIYDRMAKAIEKLLEQGVQATGSFIDVDNDVKDKSIQAAQKIRDKYSKDITIKYLNQSSYGILTEEARQWFEVGADFVDIIGGLLKADHGHEVEHLDILMDAAKKRGKMLHVHVDEQNMLSERETDLLVAKTLEYGLQGKVVGIHGISINTRPKEEREKLYQSIADAGVMFVSCPMSWLNSTRSEELTPTHNPSTPVDEMSAHGIPVGIGLDNIADIFMPFNDAEMWHDMRALLEMNRIHDVDLLVKIATENGKKILGIK